MRRAVGIAVLLGLVVGGWVVHARSEEPTLSELRERLIGASSAHQVNEILDKAAEKIGDSLKLAAWLAELPEPARSRPYVMLRRGWALVSMGKGAEAKPIFASVVGWGGEARAVALAYLGEIARQDGELERALENLTEAARAGYHEAFVVDSARKAAHQMRADAPSKKASGVPEYARRLGDLIAAFDHPLLRGTLARMLLDDHITYAAYDADRARAWARFAAPHVLAAMQKAPESGADVQLALDGAAALRDEDRSTRGATLRFDLLAEAHRLGITPDGHSHPQAIALLAEAAAREGRYELAYRLTRERLTISDSPLAWRVRDALPPDIGD